MMRWGLALLVLALAGPAAAQELHVHKGGYARVMLGGGYASMAENIDGADTTIHGGAFGFNVDGGYFVLPNLALGADLSIFGLAKPTVTQNSMDVGSSNTTVDFIGLGLGVTYFAPGNVYLGANVGMAVASVEANNQMANSDTGVGTGAVIGKEWWVSPRWGIGLAGQFFFMHIPDHTPSGASTSFNAVGGGVLVSGSYSGGG
jgi:hypothetical protein